MSPRLRHRMPPRILWTGGIAVAIAVAAIVALRASGDDQAAPPPQVWRATATVSSAGASKPPLLPLRPAISRVVLRFVKTAVMRTHADRATLLEGWQLTGPKLKRGTTLREWLAGTSSVVPFPDGAIAPHLQIDRSSEKDALLELALYPKRKGSVPAGVFLIGLHRYGTGPKARWLVDYWAPHGSSSMPAAAG
jgi:hypothetical protein